MYYETVGQKHDIKDLKFKKEKKINNLGMGKISFLKFRDNKRNIFNNLKIKNILLKFRNTFSDNLIVRRENLMLEYLCWKHRC